MKKIVFIIAMIATAPFMRANTIELNDKMLNAETCISKFSSEYFKNCSLVVEYMDEDGVTVQQIVYQWDYETIEGCFAKIGEITPIYENNSAITVLSFRAQFD